MKALKIIGGIIAVLAAIWLIMCAMGPAKFDAGASTEMNAPASVIYATITDLNTWQDWGPWMKDDPDMTSKMGEKTQGVGASYAWESEKMGDGSLEIIEAKPNKSMKTLVKFDGMGDSYGNWNIEEMGDNSKVTWAMKSEGDIPFLARGFLLLQGDQTHFFQTGLNNIKKIAEKKAKEMPKIYRGYTVKKINVPVQNYITHREKIAMKDMTQFFGTHFPALAMNVAKAKGEMAGMPRALYYEWDEENGMVDLATAIPTTQKMKMDGYATVEVPAGKALQIDYYGSYEGIGEAHYAMDDYLKEKGLEAGLVMEEYVTDPSTQLDTSKWLTKVYYTLK